MKKLKTFLFLMTFLFSGVYLLAMKSKKPKSIPKTESIEVLPYDCLAEIVAFLALPERLLCRHLSIRFYVVFMNYDHSDLTIRRDDIKKGTEEDFLKFFVKNRTNHKNIHLLLGFDSDNRNSCIKDEEFFCRLFKPRFENIKTLMACFSYSDGGDFLKLCPGLETLAFECDCKKVSKRSVKIIDPSEPGKHADFEVESCFFREESLKHLPNLKHLELKHRRDICFTGKHSKGLESLKYHMLVKGGFGERLFFKVDYINLEKLRKLHLVFYCRFVNVRKSDFNKLKSLEELNIELDRGFREVFKINWKDFFNNKKLKKVKLSGLCFRNETTRTYIYFKWFQALEELSFILFCPGLKSFLNMLPSSIKYLYFENCKIYFDRESFVPWIRNGLVIKVGMTRKSGEFVVVKLTEENLEKVLARNNRRAKRYHRNFV